MFLLSFANFYIWIFESWHFHMWILWEMSIANANFMTAELFACQVYGIANINFMVALNSIAKVIFSRYKWPLSSLGLCIWILSELTVRHVTFMQQFMTPGHCKVSSILWLQNFNDFSTTFSTPLHTMLNVLQTWHCFGVQFYAWIKQENIFWVTILRCIKAKSI